MLKITELSKESAPRSFWAGNDKVVRSGSGRPDKTIVDLSTSKNEKSRKLTRMPNIGAIEESNFLIPDAKKAFNHLWLAFIKAPILRHFDPESHIRIKTKALRYAINGVLNQLNLGSHTPLNQWHPIAYFSRKMIPAKTQYKTHNVEVLAIVAAFKT